MKLPKIWRLWALALALGGASCGGNTGYELIPRPRGFHRLEFPKATYQNFSCPACPMAFDYPTHGRLSILPEDSCVLDVRFPQYKCTWHLTYEKLHPANPLTQSFAKYRSLIYQHSRKGRVKESPIQTASANGTFFELVGEVPTAAQFYVADSSQAVALVGAMYFQTAVKNDSLAPVISFLKTDLHHLLGSLRWNPNFETATTRPSDCNPQ